jgi:hypothetical protein
MNGSEGMDSPSAGALPVLAPGETLLLAVAFLNEGGVEGGCLCIYPSRPGPVPLSLHADAVKAAELARKTGASVVLGTARAHGHKAIVWAATPESKIRHLSGPSYGLAMLLGEISAQLNRPLPTDLVMTGEWLEDGKVGRVTEVQAKLEVVAAAAPWIRRFMLPAANFTPAIADQAAHAGIELLPVSTGADAVRLLFPNFFADLRQLRGWDLATLADLLLHETANLEARPGFWRLIASLLATDSETIALAAPLVQSKLAVVTTVALRRLDEAVAFPTEHHSRVLRSLPRERALTTLAHLVQASVMDRATDADVLWAWMKDVRLRSPRGLRPAGLRALFRRSSDAELRVYGAYARLELCWGNAELSYAINEALLRAWCEIAPNQGSYPLTQLIAYIGLNEAVAPFEAERWVNQWRMAGANLTANGDHVRQALARAAALRGSVELEKLAASLRGAKLSAGRRPEDSAGRKLVKRWLEHGEAASEQPAFSEAVASLPPLQAAWLRTSPYPTLRERLAVFPWSLE